MSKHRRTRTARLRAEATAIQRRLEQAVRPNMGGPVLGRANIAYELSERTKATGHGGIGMIAKLVNKVGLAGEIDSSLDLLKLHKPYHESDHVLNIAYNALCGGQRLQDIEARRCDAVFLDGLGVEGRPTRRPPGTSAALRRSLDPGSSGGGQPRPTEGLAASAGRVLCAAGGNRRGRQHRPDRRWHEGGDGHRLQRHLGVLGAGRIAREHQRTPISRAVGGQPTQPRGRDRLLRPGDHALPPGRVHRDPPAGRHRLLAHHRARPLGR